jgi:hypothetical protein
MNIKIPLIVFLSAFGLVIIGSIIGNIIESSGTVTTPTIGAKGINPIKAAFFALFCVMSFSFVPLAVRFFVFMQIKIGNGEFILVKFFQEHEKAIVYGFWLMMIIGFGIIFSVGKDDILNDFK